MIRGAARLSPAQKEHDGDWRRVEGPLSSRLDVELIFSAQSRSRCGLGHKTLKAERPSERRSLRYGEAAAPPGGVAEHRDG